MDDDMMARVTAAVQRGQAGERSTVRQELEAMWVPRERARSRLDAAGRRRLQQLISGALDGVKNPSSARRGLDRARAGGRGQEFTEPTRTHSSGGVCLRKGDFDSRA